MRKLFRKINLKIFAPTCLILVLLILVLLLQPVKAGQAINFLYDRCTENFGWLYLTACICSFAFLIWMTSSRFGSIKLGDKEEKPQYSQISWIAMLFTAGVGTSIVILGFLEPIYYVSSPPFLIEPLSEQAYEYAHMYGQFHWGLSAWAFYNPAIIAVAYMIYVRKEPSIRLSSACSVVLKKQTNGWLGHVIDILVVFGVVGSIATSLGIGTPVLADVIREVFGIPQAYDLTVKLTVLTIWIFIFGTSVFLGLDKGIQKLSNINIVMAFIFLLIILFVGPTVGILKMELNSTGLYLQEFFRMSTYTQPFGSGEFTKNWTVFYWGWWIAFMPMMGMFVGKISRGRTIKNVMWGQLIWGSLGCCFSFMIFGGYSLYLQKSGRVDLVSILNNEGQSQAIIAILKTLPMAKIMMLFLCIVCFVYLATTIDSCAYVLAGATTKELPPTGEPARWNRLFWALLFCMLSIALMLIGGIESVKIMSVVTGLPLIFVMFLLMVSVKKTLEKDYPQRTK
ncbi:BCCT family transporter [Faecalicatena contorta]|uniref:BCCT family transporter n=1 Tax=Faecalicatena contorta TaxID=39482 RepID=UPI00129D71B8|nr:BCCT family transporter [Faecalicatena contorta]MEE0200323.1 BCCT family transporter [Muricomes sp.]MRM89082.1 BCCT family transporter [Faecalicatena contorta]